MGTELPTVLVCDDHAVFAEAVSAALDADGRFSCIGWTQSAADALALAAEHGPDLVILDLRLPDVTGFELIGGLKGLDDPPAVLILSVAVDVRSVIGAFEAGADGFLNKHESLTAVMEAGRNVLSGDTPISASAFNAVLPRLVRQDSVPVLSVREEEVLTLVARSQSNDQIAEQLGISPNTVRNHIARVFSKLDVDNRTEAVSTAQELGLLPFTD